MKTGSFDKPPSVDVHSRCESSLGVHFVQRNRGGPCRGEAERCFATVSQPPGRSSTFTAKREVIQYRANVSYHHSIGRGSGRWYVYRGEPTGRLWCCPREICDSCPVARRHRSKPSTNQPENKTALVKGKKVTVAKRTAVDLVPIDRLKGHYMDKSKTLLAAH